MQGKQYLSLFAPRLRNAIAADLKRDLVALETESRGVVQASAYGLLDEEPICHCQFARGVRIIIHSITGGQKAARIATEVRDADGKSTKVTWDIIRERDAWAISDLEERDVRPPSLLIALERHDRPASNGN